MQIDLFTIIASRIDVPPANPNIVIIAMLVAIIFIMVGIFIVPSHKLKKYLPLLYLIAVITITAAAFYETKTNPLAYAPTVNCVYTLKSDKETITHEALAIKSNINNSCANVDTVLLRVKADSTVMFYQEFQTPASKSINK